MLRPTTDPTAIYRYRDSLAAVDALAVALVHLDLFTALARAPADLAGICGQFSLHPRPTDVLCTLLVANGLLRLSGATAAGATKPMPRTVAIETLFVRIAPDETDAEDVCRLAADAADGVWAILRELARDAGPPNPDAASETTGA
jgi:hypothetical protein